MGLFSWAGNILNDITGVNSSARQQYNNQMALQHDAQEFNKHAHQYEVEDLQAAGLNPVLSAGAQGTAPAGQGSASTGTGADPIGMIASIINTMTSAKKTEAETKNIEADTENKTITNTYLPEVTQSMIELNNATTAKTKQEKTNLVAQNVFQLLKNKILSAEKEINYGGTKITDKKEIANKAIQNQKKVLELQAKKLGINNSEWKQIWDMSMDMVGSFVKAWSPFTDVFKGGNEYNITQSTPTVNYSN